MKKIFTLFVCICAIAGTMKSQDEVPVLNLETLNFTMEGINGGAISIAKAPDSSDALALVVDSKAGWDGLATIKLNTAITLGEYVAFKCDVYVNVAGVNGYIKLFGNGNNSNAISESWSPNTVANSWVTFELTLMDDHKNGSKTRKTGILEEMMLIVGKNWSADNVAELHGVTFYFKNFKLIKGDDVPAPPQPDPIAFWNSYISKRAIKIDGLDTDLSWDTPADNYSIVSNPGKATKGTFYSTWDSQRLYFFAEIIDANSVSGYGDRTDFIGSSWKGDGIQFYFDILERRFEKSQNDQINGISYCPGMGKPSPSDAKVPLFVSEHTEKYGKFAKAEEFASTATGSKYTMEFAIPWEALFFAAKYTNQEIAEEMAKGIKTGRTMSCAFQINDFDPAKNDRVDAVSIPMPPDGKGGVFDQPIYWAQLKLIGDGTPYFDPDFKSGLGISNVSLINVRIFNVLGYINVTGENLKAVEVYNISGQKMYGSAITDNVITIPSAAFPDGVYLVKVFDNDGAFVTGKVIK